MREPSVRTSRLAITAGLIAAIAVGGTGFFFGRVTAPQPKPVAPAPVVAPLPNPVPVVELPRTLGRADLVDLASRAADAFTSGTSLPKKLADLSGQRFELSLPFGCSGPSTADSSAAMRWRYDEGEGVLRVRAVPTTWRNADWGLAPQAGAGDVEGFWIARPWSSSEECPPRAGQASPTGIEPVMLTGQTLAVAQFFKDDTKGDLRRSGRPFENVQRIKPEAFDGSRGFRLRLIGRIDRVPDGGPVRCIQPAGVEQRPICVVAIALDEVRLENAAGGTALAIWSNRTSAPRSR